MLCTLAALLMPYVIHISLFVDNCMLCTNAL